MHKYKNLWMPMPVIGMMLITGCSDMRNKLGLEAEAPDEFAVYDRAPLTVPPDFSLRPPKEGSPAAQESQISTQAEKVLTKGVLSAPLTMSVTTGKAALLHQAKTEEADASIRTKIDEDLSLETKPSDKKLLDDVLFWQKKQPKGEAIDPQKEKERLKSLTQEGSQGSSQ